MSESILIIDTPNVCIDCPCHFTDDDMVWCGAKKWELLTDDIETFKPDWCPLRVIPNKIDENNAYADCEYYRSQGYNSCIDEILKERDEK